MIVEASGSERINPPDHRKFYAPFLIIQGTVVPLKTVFKTRVAANDYAEKVSVRFMRAKANEALRKAMKPKPWWILLLNWFRKVFHATR